MEGLTVAHAHALAANQAGEGRDAIGNVEMFPSSAVAQSHVPGSASIGTLQQPPQQPSHQNHNRAPSIFQNPSFDNNKHSQYRTTATTTDCNGVSVSVCSFNQPDNQHSVEQQKTTVTTTNTATDSAMMVDDPAAPAPAPVAKTEATTQVGDNKAADNATQQNENSAVRKIR